MVTRGALGDAQPRRGIISHVGLKPRARLSPSAKHWKIASANKIIRKVYILREQSTHLTAWETA